MIRKSISILLIIVFVYNLFGWYTLFSIIRNEVRKEAAQVINEGIRHHELVQFRIEGNQHASLRWVNDHEFCFENNYFDVVSSSEVNGVLYLLCYCDKKETNLVVKFDESTNQHKKDSSPLSRTISGFLKKTLSELYCPGFLEMGSRSYKIVEFFTFKFIPGKGFAGKISPPPKSV